MRSTQSIIVILRWFLMIELARFLMIEMARVGRLAPVRPRFLMIEMARVGRLAPVRLAQVGTSWQVLKAIF